MSFNQPNEREAVVAELQAHWPKAHLVATQDEIVPIIDQLVTTDDEAGRTPVQLHIKGTNFQLQVWQALLKIPAGQIVSYEDLALSMNRPKATRAVSSAVAKNPVGYLIPCHRVIRKSGLFGKYHWGTARKKAMIGWEASQLVNDECQVSSVE